MRAIYRDVTAAAKAGRLRKVDRTFGYCRPYEDMERTLYLDARGVVRSYHFSGGSDDFAAQRALYYDRDGKLRFVMVKAGAVNGTNIEHRIYLSAAGERVWETQATYQRPRLHLPQSLAAGRPRGRCQGCLRRQEPVRVTRERRLLIRLIVRPHKCSCVEKVR